MSHALILTYHAVEQGPGPLRIEPALLARHLDVVIASGAEVVTISRLVNALGGGRLPERAVAITFDDGLASAVHAAGPLLDERELVATVFCVADRLGGQSDWPSRASWAPSFRLAGAEDLAALVERGWEIGSHGLGHEPLDAAEPARVRSELAESRRLLEEATGGTVTSYAYPYGVVPPNAGASLLEAGYTAGCTTHAGPVRPRVSPLLLPRVDASYLRRPALLLAALEGRLDAYLAARALGARARRVLRRDYVRDTL